MKYILKRLGLIFIFFILIPIPAKSQDLWIGVDSLRDHGPVLPMIINPFLDGIIPEKDYSNREIKGNRANGFRVQVISTKDANRAKLMRFILQSKVDHEVRVIFDAPNYKVRIGSFKDRYAADKVRQELFDLGYRQAWVIRARITL